MDALPLLLDSPPAYIENLDKHDDCYVTRVAYDMGSTTTKVIVARVNVCTQTIEQVISDHTYPIAFFDDVAQSDHLLFSEWMQAYALQAIQTAKMQADGDIIATPSLISPRTEHCAVATQAFRIAENGQQLAAQMSQQLGIPVNLISQEEEGKLAYLSVLSQWHAFKRQLPVVWDIGGGSAQITFRNEVGDFYVVGSDMASRSFQKIVQTKVMGEPQSVSPHPMTHAQIKLALQWAQNAMGIHSSSQRMIRERIQHQAPIVGIGKVHNLCALQWVQKCCQKAQQGYSKDDLLKVINTLANKSDAEIQQMMPNIPAHYIPSQTTNLILMVATMEKMGIDWVEVLQANNTQGLLLTGCH